MNERFLKTGPRGLSLCVCSWGTPSARPTLILHGFLEQAAAWDGVAKALGTYVVAPDHRGHGRSEHIGAGGHYHFWNYIPDVHAVVRDIGGPVDLVGHSMGGTMASLFASTYPELVRRLVLVEGLGPPDAQDPRGPRARRFVQAHAEPPQHSALADLEDAMRRIRRFTPSMTDAAARRLAERATVLRDGERFWRWDALHRARNPDGFSAARFKEALSRIEAPVLSIIGRDSPILPVDFDDRCSAIPDLERMDLPGGHMLHHDDAGSLAQAITAFLG